MRPDPDFDPPMTWHARFVRLGHWRAVAAGTAAAVGLSMILTWLGMRIASPGRAVPEVALWLAAGVAAIIAPLVTHVLMRLVFALDSAQHELTQVAIRDSLTQVYNRRYFMHQLQQESARYMRTGEGLALLMIDADEFKSVNDRFGHATGDRALQAIARACAAGLREYDVLARYGGEEFVVLLPATSLPAACEVAERVRQTVEALRIDTGTGEPIGITVSIGVSALAAPDPECKILFDAADSALYEAKRSGRNRCVCRASHARAQGAGVQGD